MDSALLLVSAAAPQSPEPQLIDLDYTVFVQLGIFLVLVLVLGRFLWKPYLRVRGERAARVENYRDTVAQIDAEAAARMARAEAALAEARRIGSIERAKARAEAQAREQALLVEANAAAQRALAEARARVNASLNAERSTLDQKAREMGLEAARRILGREITA